MTGCIDETRAPLRIGVLVSGSGTNLQAILDAIARGSLGVEVALVLSNRPRAFALERARRAGIEVAIVSHRRFDDRAAFEERLINELRARDVQCVVLAGFMRVLTGRFLEAFDGRVVNIHPALLPSFPGVDAPQQALAYGVKLAGCTVHFVDEGTDTGPIIAQAAVAVLPGDDVETLKARILAQEHRLYPAVLQALAEGRVRRHGRQVQVDGPISTDEVLLSPPFI